jgi:hypothetical protein
MLARSVDNIIKINALARLSGSVRQRNFVRRNGIGSGTAGEFGAAQDIA